MPQFQRVIAALSLSIASAATAGELVIPGAGPPEAAVRALAEAFNSAQSAHRVVVPSSTGVPGALRAIRGGETPLARMPRRLSETESREGLQCEPFARDPIVFVVGAGVAVTQLSEAQIVDIFSAKLSDWREVGSQAGTIRVVARQPTEALLGMIRQQIPEFRSLQFGPEVKVVQSDPQMIELLDRFDQSIGWAAMSNLRLAKGALRPVHLDGIAPTAANVANGKYRLAATACFLHKGALQDIAARAFMDFVHTPAGRSVIEKTGLLPTPSNHASR